jgi:hypothetical protein
MTASAAQSTGSSKDGAGDEALALQFDLVRVDYERTLGFLDSVVRTRTTLRAAAVTAYAALFGLGIQETSWAVCGSAALVALGFFLLDAYDGYQYMNALRRANDLERLFQARLRALDRLYDPYPARRLRTAVERYQFGVLTQLPRTTIPAFLKAATRGVIMSYGFAVLAAIVAAFVVG